MKSKFARTPLALAISLLLSQAATAALFEPVDLSLSTSAKAGTVGEDTARLSIPMRPLLAGYDAKKLDAESIARAHLGMMFSQQEAAKSSLESFELGSVSALENGANLVQFKRRVNGIDVFREEVGLLLDGDARLVAFRGHGALFAPTAAKSLAVFGLSAVDAAAVALSDYGYDASVIKQSLQVGRREGDYQWYDTERGLRSAAGAVNYRPVRTKPVYFPSADAGLVPAYYVETQVQPDERMSAEYYAHVISAVDGRVLFRHSQQADGSPSDIYTYRIWGEATADGWPQPSPYGRNDTPHPTGLPGFVPSFVAQTDVTIRNKPFSMNDPWLPTAASVTTGNNADGYADLGGVDGFDAGDLRAATTATNQFLHTYNTALEPASSNTQIMASVVQQFYWNNWLHDDYYDSGFAEVNGNAQSNNFGRGGLGSDRILSEGQDNTGTCAPTCANNANMSTPADGASPRMQMYVFSAVAPHTLTFNSVGYNHGTASFGAQSFNVTDDVVRSVPLEGCTAFTNGAAIAGKIAFVDRGTCNFDVKSKNAQDAGAVGVILGNVAGSPNPASPPNMPPGTTPQVGITIGTMSVNFADGEIIRTQLGDANPDTATMFRGTGVGRDGTQDGAVIAHEWGHYLSNRLVSNSSGLSNNQGRSMGEGWGDFSALMAMVKEEDRAGGPNPDFSDLYTIGSYASGDSYFAIRRYPYSTQMGKNPLMFRHIVNGVALPASPAPAFGANGASNSEVHNAGEVWAAALWECYAGLLNDTPRLTFQQARQRMKGYLVAGLKLTPPAPTFTEARDGVLAAIVAQSAADFEICAAGFAKRGMGMLAVSPPRESTTNVGAVEDTTIGGDLAATGVSGDDDSACDNDVYLDLDESGSLSIDVRNIGWVSLAGGSVSVTANHAGLAFPTGNSTSLAASTPYQSQSVNVPIRLDSVPFSRMVQFTATPTEGTIINPPGTPRIVNVRVATNEVAAMSATENFDANLYPWSTALSNGATANFAWYRTELDASGNRVAIGPDSGGAGSSSLVSDPISVGAGTFTITLAHRYQFEGGTAGDPTFWDGGQIEISTDGGTNWTSIGGAAYDGNVNGASGNPMEGQPAFVGTSTGYPATMVDTLNLGTTYASQTVRLRFTVGTDMAAGAPGWELHSVALSGAGTPFALLVPQGNSCSPTGDVMFENSFE